MSCTGISAQVRQRSHAPADRVTAERDFVRWLSVHDPRALVRSHARIAMLAPVRDRAAAVRSDADVAEFLRYGWVIGAGIESDAYRGEYVAAERPWWADTLELVGTAQATDRAAQDATGDAQAPALAAAAEAWAAVSASTAAPRAAWAEREVTTQTWADAWRQTNATAAANGPLWSPLATKAAAVRTQWLNEKRYATERLTW